MIQPTTLLDLPVGHRTLIACGQLLQARGLPIEALQISLDHELPDEAHEHRACVIVSIQGLNCYVSLGDPIDTPEGQALFAWGADRFSSEETPDEERQAMMDQTPFDMSLLDAVQAQINAVAIRIPPLVQPPTLED